MEKKSYTAGLAAKQAICAALKSLMEQKALDKISVSEVMRTCGMTRQHFYYHFDDLYAAVQWMFEEEVIKLLQDNADGLLCQDGLLRLFHYLKENRAVCLCALQSMNTLPLKQFFRTEITLIIQHTIEEIALSLHASSTRREIALLTGFYVGALSGLVEDWLSGNIPESPEELIRFTTQLLEEHILGAKMRSKPAYGTESGNAAFRL